MDGDQKFWLSVWVTAGLSFAVLCAAVAIPSTIYNGQYFEAMNHCIDHGGTWQPVGWGACLK